MYIPAYEAAVAVMGKRDVLVEGFAKMGALETRGHVRAQGSHYLCRPYAPWAAGEIAGWVEDALARPERWQRLEERDAQSGQIRSAG